MPLFIDTETNGIPGKHPNVRVVQLAMILTDDDGKSLAEHSSLIVPPEGFIIPAEAEAVHGFTVEMCEQWGIDARGAYSLFLRFAEATDKIVAHNMNFDWRMMQIEAAAVSKPLPTTRRICTMEAASPVCNLPPTQKMINAGFNKPKAPRVEEALPILCGRPLIGGHNAKADVEGCRDIFFALQAMGKI